MQLFNSSETTDWDAVVVLAGVAWLVAYFDGDWGLYLHVNSLYFRSQLFSETLIANRTIVIALVEYLTSEEAGQPLGKSFAWPVGKIVNCSAGAEKTSGFAHANGNGAAKMNGANGKKTA
jgi:hypothetical protein